MSFGDDFDGGFGMGDMPEGAIPLGPRELYSIFIRASETCVKKGSMYDKKFGRMPSPADVREIVADEVMGGIKKLIDKMKRDQDHDCDSSHRSTKRSFDTGSDFDDGTSFKPPGECKCGKCSSDGESSDMQRSMMDGDKKYCPKCKKDRKVKKSIGGYRCEQCETTFMGED